MRASSRWAALVSALGVAACGSGNSGSSITSASDGGGSGTAGAALGVRVRVSYGDIPATSAFWIQAGCGSEYAKGEQPVAPKADGKLEAVFDEVPPSVDCVFSARATRHQANPEVNIHYSASYARRFEPGDTDCQVLLTLKQDDNFAYSENTPPRIAGLGASQTTADVLGALLPGVRSAVGFSPYAVVRLDAQIQDAEGDALRYRWDDGGVGGAFLDLGSDLSQFSLWSGGDGEWRSFTGALPATLWIPPQGMAGRAHLTLTAEDTHTGSDGVTVHSRAALGADASIDDTRAQVGFEAALNHWPDVLTVQAVADASSVGGEVMPGQPAHVLATVQDLDGDSLDVTFSSDCPGAFFDGDGNQVSSARLAPLGEDRTGSLSVYFVAAALPDSRYCEVDLALDDGRGGRNSGSIDVKVVKEKPIAYGPIIEQAYATAGVIGPAVEVGLGVVAASRYGSPTLTYHADLLSPVALPQEYLPDPYHLGAFVGETSNESGTFTWRSPPSADACADTITLNGGNVLYFLVTVTDGPAASNGVPATNYVVIPIDLQCTVQLAAAEGTP